MTATKYKAKTRVAYINPETNAITCDDIWLVRDGYYHMPDDHYLYDETIIGSIEDGKHIPNDLFISEKKRERQQIMQEIELYEEWAAKAVEE
jgi:hypothetical protein